MLKLIKIKFVLFNSKKILMLKIIYVIYPIQNMKNFDQSSTLKNKKLEK